MASSAVASNFIPFINQKDVGHSAFSSQSCFLIQNPRRRISTKIVSVMAPQQSERKPSTTGSVKNAMTMTEKIFARASEKPQLSPGENVWVNVDILMTHDIVGPVWDREKIVIIPEHYIFTSDERANRNVDILRDFCTEQNIKYFYDIKDLSNFKANPDYKGVCHVALAQEGHCRPGEVLLGTDSHTCTAGAFGQFATGIGITDAGFVLGAGKLLLKVPPTLRFVMDGEMPNYLLAKDLILQIIGEISVSGAIYKSMEFVGSTVESLTMEERMTLCNMAIEAGGKNGIVPADSTTHKYLADKTSLPYEPVYSDDKARFLSEYRFDVSKLEPLVAKGKKIKVPTFLVPATQKVWMDLYSLPVPGSGGKTCSQIFEEAGCDTPASPSCGACMGGPRDTHAHMNEAQASCNVCVSTTNRNFPGRMGHKEGQIYLASPYTAAASALTGCVTDPREFLQSIYSEVKEIILCTNSGQIGVLPKHASIATAVGIGIFRIRLNDQWLTMALMGDFARMYSSWVDARAVNGDGL
ncbi:hypothetical protein RJ639_004962 [Escallonia herrerae]|uniref:3-isopropylmalate dehydratase n=1 Tax=Escallonia herrerae TaxID=1293975 RepID=A0AA89AY83_9ASTE|nr:hypothetical protein RJ639_004962 [Escallonia herrerae]